MTMDGMAAMAPATPAFAVVPTPGAAVDGDAAGFLAVLGALAASPSAGTPQPAAGMQATATQPGHGLAATLGMAELPGEAKATDEPDADEPQATDGSAGAIAGLPACVPPLLPVAIVVPATALQTDEDGRIVSDRAGQMLEHAQRVAEGRLLDVHANTWRYNQLTAQQRAIIVERRETLLRTTTARDELKELTPDRYQELADEVGEDELERICRMIMLYHLDRGWADHLAYLSDIRESIHLRALGRQDPLDEFHRMAVDAFASLAADAIEAAQQTFETANVLADEPGLDLSKLARPTSTWTYMIHDNPLADDTMAALSLPGVFR